MIYNYKDFYNDVIMLPNGREVKIRVKHNSILGIVSNNQYIRNYIFDCLSTHVQNAYDEKKSSKGKNMFEDLEDRSKNKDIDYLETYLRIAGLIDKKDSMVEGLNAFEKVKLSILRQALTDQRILVLKEIFDDLPREECGELNNIIIEFSVWNTFIIIIDPQYSSECIFDKIINIDKEII